MDAVRRAIGGWLLGTPAITQLLGAPTGVYHRRAPVDAVDPFVIFHRQAAGDDDRTFDGSPLVRDLWTIRAVSRRSSAETAHDLSAAEDIAAAIHQAMHWATIPVEGFSVSNIVRTQQIDYGEPDGAEHYEHIGAIYRFDLTPQT